jgi:hypothetical protein
MKKISRFVKTMIRHQLPLFVNSALGINQTDNGDSFDVNFQPPINIPSSATSVTVACHGADIFYSFVNVATGTTFDFTATLSGGSTVTKQITFLKCLYSLAAIQSEIDAFCQADSQLPDNMWTLVGSAATGRVTIGFNADATGLNLVAASILFGNSTAFATLLGFAQSTLSFTAASGVTLVQVTGTLVANFSSLSHVDLKSDLAGGGAIQADGERGQTLASIVPDVSPGQQINFTPPNLIEIDANHLVGHPINKARFYLTDQNGGSVDTNSETWSARIILSWYVKAL